MYTGNPIDDAIMHIHDQDSKDYEFDYKCTWCEDGFDSGFGGTVEGLPFDDKCLNTSKYLIHFREVEGLKEEYLKQLDQLIKRV